MQGKVAIITGGSRGIGRACAAAFIAAGASVVITGRDTGSLAVAAAQLGPRASTFAGDAADPQVAEQCVAQALAAHGRLDILVNNAGGPPDDGPLLDVPPEVLEETWRFNVAGPLAWTRAAWRAAMRERGGVVLNIGSIGGLTTPRAMGAYALCKAAVHHMTRVLAAELGPGVRVNAIAPGITRTAATARATVHEAAIRKRLPLERIGEPEDIAKAALFLVSDASSWITGEILLVDGGTMVQWGRLGRGGD